MNETTSTNALIVDPATTTSEAVTAAATGTAPTGDPFFLDLIGGLIPLGDAHPITIITGIIRALLNLLSIVFMIMVLWAGFRWMLSGGDEEKTGAARRTLLNAIIGVIIILISQTIVRFVFNALTSVPADSPSL